jgi:hypothetical protein
MVKKFLFFLVFSFLLSTANTFACEKKSNKCCCKTEKPATSKKECCKETTKNNKQNKSCNGKCGHAGCNIPNVQLVVIVPFITEIDATPFYKSSNSLRFCDYETHVSGGYKSIWLPPVIG